MLALVLVAVLHYTVPDSQAVVPVAQQAKCDSSVFGNEHMGTVEIMYGARWGSYRLLRVKNVAGLEGQRDTIQVPDDTLATVYLVAVDAAGNRAVCGSPPYTVGARVGVGSSVPPTRDGPLQWYDIAGRRLAGKPKKTGVYWEIGRGRRRVIVVK